jgi:hypothetical protein
MKEDGDFTELIKKIPADKAFRKASDSGCKMS